MHLRISPRHLGQIKLADSCPRCYWYLVQLAFKRPWDLPMPGLMYHMDGFEKRIVRERLQAHGSLPEWLKPLNCTGCATFPAKMTVDFPDLDITMVGKPDEVFKKKNGHLYLVDYKTAMAKPDDPFLPAYDIQLQGYVRLLEENNIGSVDAAALVYFQNALKDADLDPLALITDQGFDVPFRVKIHELAIDRQAIDPLLKQVRELADMKNPPEGRENCDNCPILQRLFDLEVNSREREQAWRRKDGLGHAVWREREAVRNELRLRWSSDGADASESVPDFIDSAPGPLDL